jgi:hypothetical protein
LGSQAPSRGAVEAKPTDDDVDVIKDTEQVRKYLDRYNQVLITNFRSFLLVGRDDDGGPIAGEAYHLAPSEAAFWSAAADPRATAVGHGDQLIEYLKRVTLHPVPLAAPRDLAWFLASYARDARARIDRAGMDELATVREGFEQALGLTFEGEQGEHFFRSTLVQTLFYGLFSAWVLWTKTPPTKRPFPTFSWRGAVWMLGVPMIRSLFEQIVTPTHTSRLDLLDVLDWAEATLNRIDPGEFFQRFEETHAVQYFYEPFLEAFDPELRKQLGVWYTPPEIVRYMVARVDAVLRTELGIADGLADPRVYVLDPCCGTGAYAVEVLRRIHATLVANGASALAGLDVKRAARERVFGFEILPAPFVVAHLQLGLLLQDFGAPLEATGERAGVYLMNALTGWEPPQGAKRRLPLKEFEEERDAAEKVKRETPILVVLGNPPYNAYAGVSPEEEHGLVEPYKAGLRETWGIKKFNLDDLYIRFFRVAERRIAEQTGRGIVCYISNFSYLRERSFVVMRERLLDQFDALWFDNLNGDSRETGKTTAEGKPDPSVFSTEYNREGIRVGTVIGLLARKPSRDAESNVRYRELWGVGKRAELEASLSAMDFDGQYQTVTPTRANRYSFRPGAVSEDYYAWPRVDGLASTPPMPGLLEKRRGALVSVDRAVLERRMRAYLDPAVDWETARALAPGLTTDAARFDAKLARQRLQAGEPFDPSAIRRFMVLPMDVRWCYYTGVRPIWNESRPQYAAQCWEGNAALATRKTAVANPEGVPFFVTSTIADEHAFLKDAYYVPLMLRRGAISANGPARQDGLFAGLPETAPVTVANLSPATRAYLASLGIADPDTDPETAALIWQHVLAIGYARRTSPSTRTVSVTTGRASRCQLQPSGCVPRPSLGSSSPRCWTPSSRYPASRSARLGPNSGQSRPSPRRTVARWTRTLATWTCALAGATSARMASSWAGPAG